MALFFRCGAGLFLALEGSDGVNSCKGMAICSAAGASSDSFGGVSRRVRLFRAGFCAFSVATRGLRRGFAGAAASASALSETVFSAGTSTAFPAGFSAGALAPASMAAAVFPPSTGCFSASFGTEAACGTCCAWVCASAARFAAASCASSTISTSLLLAVPAGTFAPSSLASLRSSTTVFICSV